MLIALHADLQKALAEKARELGTHPQFLAHNLLCRAMGLPEFNYEPQDEWEARLVRHAKDYGVGVSDEALSSDGLYD